MAAVTICSDFEAQNSFSVSLVVRKCKLKLDFPSGAAGKEHAYQCMRLRDRFSLRAGTIPRRRAWQPAPVFLPGESHGQRRLTGHSAGDCKESDMTERRALTAFLCIPEVKRVMIRCTHTLWNDYQGQDNEHAHLVTQLILRTQDLLPANCKYTTQSY